jgi:hypothetical protein
MAVTPPSSRPAHGNTLQAKGVKLGGGRCASGAVQREGIAWRCVMRQRRIPGYDLRRANKIQPGSRQRRHVQRLADMASSIGPIRMLVEKRSARSKIEQRGASQQRQRAAHNCSPENRSLRIHLSTLYLSILDEPATRLVAPNALKVTRQFQPIPHSFDLQIRRTIQLFQVRPNDVDQFLGGGSLRGILGTIRVQDMEPDMALD